MNMPKNAGVNCPQGKGLAILQMILDQKEKRMKKYLMILIGMIFTSLSFFAAEAIDILRRIDTNEVYSSIKYEGEMTITANGKKFVKSFYAYGQGNKNMFCEFTNSDDAGTKYMKKDGNLFVYSPDSEEVIPITGHMLKESMMGSDMSYEDTINNDTLESQYNVAIIEETQYEGKNVWVIELTGKTRTLSYPKKKMWVDKENFTVWKSEFYALSGVLLKEQHVLEYKKIGERYFPINVEMKDLLRKNSMTVFKMNNVQLDVKIPDNMFSLKNLEK
jgi:outer membrane lipoprotein-sorting protein